MFTIYRATNKLNGHSYIGFDCKWPYRRTAHKTAVKRGSTLVFHNALRSYGWDNFEWTIIEQSNDGRKLLKEQEEYYIRKYDTFYMNGNGYNMTYGGEGSLGWTPSEETRIKIGNANRRSTLTEEGRKRKSEFMRNNNPTLREDVKETLRLKSTASKTTARKVTNGITIFDSIRDANKAFPECKYNTLYHWISHKKNGWNYT